MVPAFLINNLIPKNKIKDKKANNKNIWALEKRFGGDLASGGGDLHFACDLFSFPQGASASSSL